MLKRQERTRSTRSQIWPAPVAGWVTRGGKVKAPLDSAEVLDNFFPTAETANLRAGAELQATVGAAPVQFLPYVSGSASALFVSTATEIVNITSPADPTEAETATLSGLSSGDWSSVQFATSGGEFMVAANGSDYMVLYDGTNMDPIADQAVFDLAYDALTSAFTVGNTITGGTSGATATLLAIAPADATTGTLKIGTITGTFQDNETLTDGATGSATSNIPSGTSSASSITITGIATTSVSHVWQHKERLFLIEKDKLSFWYLPVESIGGAATEFPLGAVFRKGGKLLFGATWSLDAGSGLDDKCIFVTDEGEVAVYEGTDPGDASYWQLVGVYQVGRPINKHCVVQIGGEAHFLVEEGIIPISRAVARGVVGGAEVGLTAPIFDAWQDAIAQQTITYPMNVAVWSSRGAIYVGTPVVDGSAVAYVANVDTGGKWCRYVGWDMRCSTVHQDQLYFGTGANTILKGESGGTDNGVAYTGEYVGKSIDSAGGKLHANHLQVIATAQSTAAFSAGVMTDYTVDAITAPTAMAELTDASGAGYVRWKAVRGQGHAVAPWIAVTCQQETNALAFDAQTQAFSAGQTVTGGTSGASASILAVATGEGGTGTLTVGVIAGEFQDNETITGASSGSATSDIPSGVVKTGLAPTFKIDRCMLRYEEGVNL